MYPRLQGRTIQDVLALKNINILTLIQQLLVITSLDADINLN